MATVTVIKCNRCGSECPQRGASKITRFDKDYHGTNQDLCTTCLADFQAFMGNVPVRRKPLPEGGASARTCPHRVPCTCGR